MNSPLSSGRRFAGVADCLLKGNGATNAVSVGYRILLGLVDAIPGHWDKQKRRKALYLAISDEDLLTAIDMMKFSAWGRRAYGRKSERESSPSSSFRSMKNRRGVPGTHGTPMLSQTDCKVTFCILSLLHEQSATQDT
jgi:hypothetical protein